MSYRRLSVATAAAALACVLAGGAWAQGKPSKPVDFTVKSEPIAVVPNAGNVLKWDARKGRFGFTLDMQQPGERPQVLNDISAGAYFRITPTLKVGGSFALGEQDLTPRANAARPAAAPKVRLETAFKF
jgi:hypothetical protein